MNRRRLASGSCRGVEAALSQSRDSRSGDVERSGRDKPQQTAAARRARALAEPLERQVAANRSTCSRLTSRRSPGRAGHRRSSREAHSRPESSRDGSCLLRRTASGCDADGTPSEERAMSVHQVIRAVIVAVLALLVGAGSASAATDHEHHHPRRTDPREHRRRPRTPRPRPPRRRRAAQDGRHPGRLLAAGRHGVLPVDAGPIG